MFPSVTNSSTQYVDDSSLARASVYLPAWERKEDLLGLRLFLIIALYMVSVNQLKTLISQPFMPPILGKCNLLVLLLR